MILSSLVLPQFGHLEQSYHIFMYLKKHHNTETVFDLTEPTIVEKLFERQDWRNSVYATDDTGLKEVLNRNISEPQS